MKFAPIIDPAQRKPAPKPVRVDLRIVFSLGTGLWAIALIVSIVLNMMGFKMTEICIVCICGVATGLILLVWEHFDRWDYRRLGQ